MSDSSQRSGKVKWFDFNKKIGTLKTTEDGQLKFHMSAILDDSHPYIGLIYNYDIGLFEGKKVAANMSLSQANPNISEPKCKSSTDILEWAYLPFLNQKDAEGSTIINNLSKLALEEDWRYKDHNNDNCDEFGVLKNYIQYTFTRLRYEEKIVEKPSYAAFNTGLVNRFYEPIYAFFERNTFSNKQPWKLRAFCVPGQGKQGKLLTSTFESLPRSAKYFTDISEIYFDADADFEEDVEHIVLDGIKENRYPHEFLEKYTNDFSESEYKKSPKEHLKKVADLLNEDDAKIRSFRNRLSEAIKLARSRARWNYRAVVPQYYLKHNTMTFLLPLSLLEDTKIDAALVVQRIPGDKLRYQGHTIFPLSIAYQNARLVAKPISDWLNPEKIMGDSKQNPNTYAVPTSPSLVSQAS